MQYFCIYNKMILSILNVINLLHVVRIMAKNTQTTSGPAFKEELSGTSEHSNLAEWALANGKNIAYILCALLIAVVLLYRFSSTRANETEGDYIKASNAFIAFSKAHESSNDAGQAAQTSLNELTRLMTKHPELHAQYDGSIAQILLNRSDVPEALKFANATLARTSVNHLENQADFASTTLLIAEQQYKQALEKSLKLQEKLGKQIDESSLNSSPIYGEELFAINLFRIAMLQQKLKNSAAELQTWQLWQQYANLNHNERPQTVNINREIFRSVIQRLSIENISLTDYINQREKSLS